MNSPEILRFLERNNGAVLYWQVDDEEAWQRARDNGIIFMDWESDCYVHPLAVPNGDGSFFMADGEFSVLIV